ncbi:LysR family transcriptional regulator [Paraburkholderia tropica]|uniref:LysR family transcriptional regulator n=1 Tax=Paraburkholderia tropica TaxID=92647 RepID=UPI0015901E4D|nr:LysR family transcriptional regulator [Paraburkholderia tropica]
MNKLLAMRLFIHVVDLENFGLAAKQLGLSPASASRSINQLETDLNMRLLNRTTRGMSLTEAGHHYSEGCRAVIGKLDELDSNLSRATSETCGVLRIAAPSAFSSTDLANALAAYRDRNPRIDFDITNYGTDIDFIVGSYDVSFATKRQTINANLVCRALTQVEYCLVASPGWFASNDNPHSGTEIPEQEIIWSSDLARAFDITIGGIKHRVNARGSMVVTHHTTAKSAAVAGMGIALLPSETTYEEVDEGTLVRMLADSTISCSGSDISIIYSGRSRLSAKVKDFIDFVVDYFRTSN